MDDSLQEDNILLQQIVQNKKKTQNHLTFFFRPSENSTSGVLLNDGSGFSPSRRTATATNGTVAAGLTSIVGGVKFRYFQESTCHTCANLERYDTIIYIYTYIILNHIISHYIHHISSYRITVHHHIILDYMTILHHIMSVEITFHSSPRSQAPAKHTLQHCDGFQLTVH